MGTVPWWRMSLVAVKITVPAGPGQGFIWDGDTNRSITPSGIVPNCSRMGTANLVARLEMYSKGPPLIVTSLR